MNDLDKQKVERVERPIAVILPELKKMIEDLLLIRALSINPKQFKEGPGAVALHTFIQAVEQLERGVDVEISVFRKEHPHIVLVLEEFTKHLAELGSLAQTLRNDSHRSADDFRKLFFAAYFSAEDAHDKFVPLVQNMQFSAHERRAA